jgi:hypothetical protein
MSKRYRIEVVLNGALALVLFAISGVGGDTIWIGLAGAALFASRAMYALQMSQTERRVDPSTTVMARAFRTLGQAYCVVSVLWFVSAATEEHILGWFAGPGFLILGGTYWFLGRGVGQSGSTWSPFQSPEVQEICAHLTADEAERLANNGRRCGRELAVLLAIPVGIVVLLFLWSVRVGLLAVVVLFLYFWVIAWPRMQEMRVRSRELICECEWARRRRYTPATLRLFVPPWSR